MHPLNLNSTQATDFYNNCCCCNIAQLVYLFTFDCIFYIPPDTYFLDRILDVDGIQCGTVILYSFIWAHWSVLLSLLTFSLLGLATVSRSGVNVDELVACNFENFKFFMWTMKSFIAWNLVGTKKSRVEAIYVCTYFVTNFPRQFTKNGRCQFFKIFLTWCTQ